MYSPTLGRFIQLDPIETGDTNKYMFVHNSPTSGVDPTGLIESSSRALAQRAAISFSESTSVWVSSGERGEARGWLTVAENAKVPGGKGIYISFSGKCFKNVRIIQFAETRILHSTGPAAQVMGIPMPFGQLALADQTFRGSLSQHGVGGIIPVNQQSTTDPANPRYYPDTSSTTALRYTFEGVGGYTGNEVFMMDVPQVGNLLTENIRSSFLNPFAPARPTGIHVVFYFDTYLVENQRAFARVSWNQESSWDARSNTVSGPHINVTYMGEDLGHRIGGQITAAQQFFPNSAAEIRP